MFVKSGSFGINLNSSRLNLKKMNHYIRRKSLNTEGLGVCGYLK